MKWRIRVVIPHIRGRLLDIGCGTNQLVKNYKGEGIGVDVYQWGSVDFVVEDSSKLPFNDQEFDTVTFIASFNHIPYRLAVLKEAFRVLKKDGIIIITILPPFISKIWHIIRKPWDADQKERGMKNGEVYGLKQKEIEFLFKKSNFFICYKTRFMMGINSLIVGCKKQSELAIF